MAKAAKVQHIVSITLVLSEAEARTIAALSRYVGGSCDGSPRAHVTAIADALYDIGIGDQDNPEGALVEKGTVYFKNYPGV